MKKLLPILFFISSFNLFSAIKIELSIDNPMPRVGDNVELTFDLNPLTKALRSQMPTGVRLEDAKDWFGNTNSKMKKSIAFDKAGNYTVGPFSFTVNGNEYITDSIQVQVAEELPLKAGVWVRYLETNGKKYIVVEQLVKQESTKTKTKDGYSYSTENKKDFAELNGNPQKGVIISNPSSRSNSRKKEGKDFMDPGLGYSYKLYEIKFTDEFNGVFKLKKSHFNNLPRKTSIGTIIIKE